MGIFATCDPWVLVDIHVATDQEAPDKNETKQTGRFSLHLLKLGVWHLTLLSWCHKYCIYMLEMLAPAPGL